LFFLGLGRAQPSIISLGLGPAQPICWARPSQPDPATGPSQWPGRVKANKKHACCGLCEVIHKLIWSVKAKENYSMKAKESLPVLLECYCFGRRSVNTLLAGKLEFLLLPLLSYPLLLLLSVVCLLSASVFFRNEGMKMMMMPVLPDGFGSGSFFFSAIFPFSCLLVAASDFGFFFWILCAFFFPPLLLGVLLPSPLCPFLSVFAFGLWLFFFSLLCFFEKKQRNASLLFFFFFSLLPAVPPLCFSAVRGFYSQRRQCRFFQP